MYQVGLAGVKDGRLKLPRGVAKDEAGRDLADIGIGASDVAALVLGLGAAGLDLWWGHTNFTLNNLLACLIACDILGVSVAQSGLKPAQGSVSNKSALMHDQCAPCLLPTYWSNVTGLKAHASPDGCLKLSIEVLRNP